MTSSGKIAKLGPPPGVPTHKLVPLPVLSVASPHPRRWSCAWQDLSTRLTSTNHPKRGDRRSLESRILNTLQEREPRTRSCTPAFLALHPRHHTTTPISLCAVWLSALCLNTHPPMSGPRTSRHVPPRLWRVPRPRWPVAAGIKLGASPVLPHSLILAHASLEHHTSPAGASCTRPVVVVLRRLRRLAPKQRSKPMKTGCLIRLELVVDSCLDPTPSATRNSKNAQCRTLRPDA
ncbi:hypothetical protein C8Q74DRAFT_257444 [Fomes fomentarius]|nr:hypothetical protein C8Q74DRAFT_257444 [Fomes fomentarius]